MRFIDKLIRIEKKKQIATESSPVDELRGRRTWRGFAASQQNDASSTSPITVSTKNDQRIGLFELTPKEIEKTIDVVAVHGLQGDAFKTWEHENGSMWLQDFLPADIPDARIMTFGYDSTVAFSRSVAKIEDKALELLNHLSAKRFSAASGTSRPIVFVCHSLGGIVVKKALILAHERNSFPDYKDISDNARAIAFLGVPHKGSDSAWWAGFAASLLKSASIGTSTNTALVSDLEKGAITLANISKQFVDRTRDMIIYTFYETERLHGVKVVDERSALIGLANERLFPVNANHRTMCKIPSSTSHQYRTVGWWIANLTETVLSNAVLPKTALAEAQLPSYYDVPNRRIRQFVGREGTFQRIDDALSFGSGPRIAVLQGMGGQGKSQIALEYCHRKKNTLYSAIFWVDATTKNSVERSFEAISEQVKKPDNVLPDIKARVAFVLKTVSSWPVPWLLVFDNYDNPDTFPNIADFIPQSELGAILVTSRHVDSRTLVLNQSNCFIALQGLERDAAIFLLVQQSETDDFDSEDAEKIVERLGCHPLAITQAGAYIRKRNLQLCKFMDHYNLRKRVILENTPQLSQYMKKLGNSEDETSLNVFTTWELSFQQLQSQASKNNCNVKLLTLLAFFDSKDISEQLFSEFDVNEKGKTESAKPLTWLSAFTNASGQWDSCLFEDALISLRDLSLVQDFVQKADGFYHLSLHPLIKDWIRLRTDRLVAQGITFAAAMLVSKMLENSWGNEHFQLSVLAKQNILSHIIALREIDEELFSSKADIPFHKKDFDEYTSLQSMFAKYLWDAGSYDLAEIVYQRVNERNHNVWGPEHPHTLTSMGNHASTFWSQGRWKEAEELETRVLETRKKMFKPEHPDTMISMGNLASTLWNQGRDNEAEELEVQVVETRSRVLGLEHPDTLTSMSNLASTFWGRGRRGEAAELESQVLETRKRVLGLEHPSTLISMGNLASTYSYQGRDKEAEELGAQVVESRSRVLGPEHPDTLTSISNLASTFWKQGRQKEAAELESQVLETRKRVLGLEHPSTLKSLFNLTYRIHGEGKELGEPILLGR